MPEKMRRRETADVLECGPTEPQEVKKYVSPSIKVISELLLRNFLLMVRDKNTVLI